MADIESKAGASKAFDSVVAESVALCDLWQRDPDPESWGVLAYGVLSRFSDVVDALEHLRLKAAA